MRGIDELVRNPPIIAAALAALLALGGACSENLAPGGDDGDGDGDAPGVDAGPIAKIVTTANGDGTFTSVVDATSDTAWVYLDLETRAEVVEGAPSWDLGFQRFHIKLDGGQSGPGMGAALALPGAAFDEVVGAPAATYASDTTEQLVFESGDGWYAYDTATHVLTPRDIVWIVRSAEGEHYKLQILDYYDDAGSPARLKLRWGPLGAPPVDDKLVVDAKVAGTWTYLSVTAGVITVADPATSTAWDLRLSRTQIGSNGGASGPGFAGARLAPAGVAYEEIVDATTLGHDADALLPLPGPPGSGTAPGNPALAGWYAYDPATHVVSPRDVVFLVRTAAGAYAKLQIVGWDDGTYTLRLAPVARDASVQTTTIDASAQGAWVHVDLRRGEVVTPAAPGSDAGWDLALSRTLVATNSGTSGIGGGGAADPSAGSLDLVLEASGAAFAVDAMQPLPGPPGSGEYSGNPVLGAWYDYDPVTHAVSPKAKAFLVRTADGGAVKVQVTSWSNGVFGLAWAYAGAGRSDFQSEGSMP